MDKVFKAAVVQAAPEFMDLNACVEKAIGLIEKAASEGARIIAFSECWFPGYPWWIWFSAAAHNLKYFQQYHENCMVVGGDAFNRLADAAKKNKIFISAGVSEGSTSSINAATPAT